MTSYQVRSTGGEDLGWHSGARIVAMAARGEIGLDDEVQNPLTDEWVRAGNIKALGLACPTQHDGPAWYYKNDQQSVGPLMLDALQRMAATGELTEYMLVSDNNREWRHAREFDVLSFGTAVGEDGEIDLFPDAALPMATPAPVPQPAPNAGGNKLILAAIPLVLVVVVVGAIFFFKGGSPGGTPAAAVAESFMSAWSKGGAPGAVEFLDPRASDDTRAMLSALRIEQWDGAVTDLGPSTLSLPAGSQHDVRQFWTSPLCKTDDQPTKVELEISVSIDQGKVIRVIRQ